MDGWFAYFKKRYNITLQKVCGEANKVPEGTASERNKSFLMILKNYDSSVVFNMDGSEIFFKLQLDGTLNMRGNLCHDGNKSKQRVLLQLFID